MRNTSIARKALCWLVAAMTCIALGACVEIEYAPSDGGGTGGGTSSSGGSLSDMVSSGLTIQAERGKEELEINRVEPSGKRPANLQDDTAPRVATRCALWWRPAVPGPGATTP